MLIFLVPMPLYNLPCVRLQLSNMSLECSISYGKLESTNKTLQNVSHLILLFCCISNGTNILMNVKMEKLSTEISVIKCLINSNAMKK
jgi:hypothetical protein